MRSMLPALHLGTRDALAKEHWPEGMAFDAEHEELLRRGWPDIRLLGPDEPKPASVATKHLSALDPTRFVRWPRDAARLYVRGFASGLGGPRTQAKIDAKDAGDVDGAVLDGVLSRMGGLGYVFLMRDALLLAEAFVGSPAAAERTIAALEGFSPQPANDRPSLWAIVVVGCLELFVLRADDATLHDDVERRLRALAAKHAGTLFGDRCRLTVEGAGVYPTLKDRFHYDVQHLLVDAASIDAYLAHEYGDWLYTPQIARVFGPGRAPAKLASAAKRQPAWKQEERCVAFGPIRHPFVGALMSGMVGSKGAKGLPEGWLAAHPELAPSGIEPATIAPAKKKVRRPSAKAVDRTVRAALSALFEAMTTARGDDAAERSAITACVHAIIEVRAASGEVLPEAHVGHILMLDGWSGERAPLGGIAASEAELSRWGAMIDEATRS